MLLLFETAAGYALFKVLNKGKIDAAEVRQICIAAERPMRFECDPVPSPPPMHACVSPNKWQTFGAV